MLAMGRRRIACNGTGDTRWKVPGALERVFDFVQGITAVARSKPQQDARLVMEWKAKVLLEKVRKPYP
jgi:hypothetical protein